jgi:lysozyme
MKWLLVSLGLMVSPAAPVAAPPVTCHQTCVVSEQGYELVKTFEGYMPFPYKDIAGIDTVGYGYVILPGDKFTYPMLPPDADKLLKKTMAKFERDINKSVVVKLKQNQFDALGSFTYNVGSGSLRSSTLLKRVNQGRDMDIPACFLMWNKATIKGVRQPVNALTVRRKTEADHYMSR